MPALIIDSAVGRCAIGLFFRSMKDAERFKTFVSIYIDECSPVVRAYWVSPNCSIVQAKNNSARFATALKKNIVEKMLQEVIAARTAGEGGQAQLILSGGKNGIRFQINNLPERIRPRVGDMCHTLVSQGAVLGGDYRVIAEDGDVFSIVPPYYHMGDKIEQKHITTIEAGKVMKIFDRKS